jgi:hypothetical protein
MIICFLFPFIYGLFVDGGQYPELKIILFIVTDVTQLIFLMLEIVEIYQKESFKDYFVGWNVNDFTLPFMYQLHIFFYYHWHQYEEHRKYKALTFNYITIAVLFQSVFKCL